jgi:AraC family transcriptional regulator
MSGISRSNGLTLNRSVLQPPECTSCCLDSGMSQGVSLHIAVPETRRFNPEENRHLAIIESPSDDLMRVGAGSGEENAATISTKADSAILLSALVKLLDSARGALPGGQLEAKEFIASAAALVLAEIERDETKDRTPVAATADTHLAPWQARRAMQFIDENLSRTIRIEEVAAVARLSVGHFSKAFRADFGVSPHGLVIRRRIERAKEMMLVTKQPLASIALSCGLVDQAHLTRLFRRLVGVTPARWRRLHSSAHQLSLIRPSRC